MDASFLLNKLKKPEKIVKQAQAIANDAKFCLSCPKKPTCKSICPELEKILPKPRSGGHKKERVQSTDLLDHLPEDAKLGGIYYPSIYGKQKSAEGKHLLQRKYRE